MITGCQLGALPLTAGRLLDANSVSGRQKSIADKDRTDQTDSGAH